ncbi:HlyD family efflux transporter periplasmic adaptor subunit [Verrucosispora sp. WMMC514]|uniref:efflux RND transporter periplasmic adaptor subunit n=1 Tax=Verrucosispora sp. WMMC514 TaxID=3015156 RepID=UPI00248CD2C8|nr:HlyD family efflux transporter periplasmic adaptor subunit [Verrucosispora sp. WMMC514]WBB92901.1 HlyD family efflux transporter periplasmic adaptor subunit [Verrucosispora sp. WMMC514]
MCRVRRSDSPRLPAMRLRLLTVLLAVTVLTVTTAASCGGDEPSITLAAAARAAVAEEIDAPATVVARAAATLTAPADGTLARLRVKPGQQVKRGQVLAVISSPSARERLRQARDALNAAKRAGGGGDLVGSLRGTDRAAEQTHAAARAAAVRIDDPKLRKALLTQVEAAQRRYDAAARAADRAVREVQRGVRKLNSAVSALATAQRLQAQQAYDLAKANVDALTLRAPIAGVVQPGGVSSGGGSAGALAGLLESGGIPAGIGAEALGAPAGPPPGVDTAIPVGGRVTAGTAVLTVVDTRDLGLLAEVDETDVLLVRPGLTGTVELDAVPGASYPATVRSIDVLPSTSARGGVSYRVRLALGDGRFGEAEPAPTPRPGMNAVLRLRVREEADAVTVPASALFSVDGRDTVWLVRDGRADRAVVTVGVQGQDLVQIVDGVQAGDRIVVRGTDQIREGQEIG